MSDTKSRRILILGSCWSGKSHLIKRLENFCSSSKENHNEFILTKPTVGRTITSIKYQSKHFLELHEVGGKLVSSWNNYYMNNCYEKLIYVIDSTQPWTISFTFEQLKEISNQIPIRSKNILLIFNKVNEYHSLNKFALMELLDLNSLWKEKVQIRNHMNIMESKNILSY